MFQFNKIKNLDLVLVVCVVILMVIGAMNVFATTFYPSREVSSEFYNQVIFYTLGSVAAIIVSLFDYRKLKNRYLQLLIFLITIASLILVLIIGTTRYGATRWISFGSFLFQPSELAKITVIIITSYILSLNQGIKLAKDRQSLLNQIKQHESKRKVFLVFILKLGEYLLSQVFRKKVLVLITWATFAFLIMQQHSLGNTMLLSGIVLTILIYSQKFSWPTISYLFSAISSVAISFNLVRLSLDVENVQTVLGLELHTPTLLIAFMVAVVLANIFKASYLKTTLIFLVLILSSIGLSFAYNNFLQPYQRVRIDSFLQVGGGELDQTSNWNRQQSLIACGSGKVLGKGFAEGTQSNYKFLPFSFTDFAYCGYVEQFGLFGATLLVGVYIVLLYRLLKFADKTRDRFGEYMLIGIFALFLLNMFQHIGMNIGLLPITGVPLPIISYGGTSVIISLLSLGLAQSIVNYSEQRKTIIKPKVSSRQRRGI